MEASSSPPSPAMRLGRQNAVPAAQPVKLSRELSFVCEVGSADATPVQPSSGMAYAAGFAFVSLPAASRDLPQVRPGQETLLGCMVFTAPCPSMQQLDICSLPSSAA
ncbi:hypothetical protein ABPG75_004609 [Micractinium tetrahymenae]